MLIDEATELGELGAAESVRTREGHRRQPVFGVGLGPLDVDVRGLLALVTEEEEPVARDPQAVGMPKCRAGPAQPGGGGRGDLTPTFSCERIK